MSVFIETNTGRQSKGNLLLRTLAMPSDTNANGDIFGGWIMSQMDMGGAILAKEIAHGRVVTVAVDSMTFIKPIAVGDVVCCYGQCVKIGRSSVQIKMEVWVKKVASEPIGERYCVTEAIFTFVAVDKEGKSRTIPRENNPELEKALAQISAEPQK
ncbi:acyl-CoA esterase [Canicola haemoglobinophilus]|uniref:Acyl-CoA hydrolase n=2 Tax=Bacteria TaxID=2 RepID=A0A1V4B1B0_9PAST|nr:acyl-CoA thioester hydrolase YciA [Canicola haemoglobinophilus]MBN6711794.1 acyl-CoA thioester hydrolase YciA [Canicola haemoglobinophilus]MBN6711986.1 acyl-CoA thioester hydrolase YciA [Canicola haemoglobinophilus]OOS00694.1 acyl-CoA esterase [Canicola haemoglobinophilus]STO60221.1 acyl-CoA hydrolase [Canicola haemoglobinophilus]